MRGEKLAQPGVRGCITCPERRSSFDRLRMSGVEGLRTNGVEALRMTGVEGPCTPKLQILGGTLGDVVFHPPACFVDLGCLTGV